jgi:hypothetical protein
MATSKIYKLFKEVKDCEGKIAALMNKKTDAKKELEELLKKNFYRLRDFIAKALYEELGDEQKRKIDLKKLEAQKKEEQRKLLKELGVKDNEDWLSDSTVYSWNSLNSDFDPFVDQFEIYDCKLSEDKKSMKIRVECLKNRQYLGISGCWIPSTYETGWISIKEIAEYEK